jgi:hypothetical protein
VTAFAWDDDSGIAGGTVKVGDAPPAPMEWSGSAFTAQVGLGLPARLYPISIQVRDVAGNEATTETPDAGRLRSGGRVRERDRVDRSRSERGR